MNKNMIILIGILLLWLLVIRPLSKSGNSSTSEDTGDSVDYSDDVLESYDITLTSYDDNNYVSTSKSNNTTYEDNSSLKVGGNTYTK